MNVCVNYWIDKNYTSDIYFKNVVRLHKNDKKKTFTVEQKNGKIYTFKDYLIESILIGVNPDYVEEGRRWI